MKQAWGARTALAAGVNDAVRRARSLRGGTGERARAERGVRKRVVGARLHAQSTCVSYEHRAHASVMSAEHMRQYEGSTFRFCLAALGALCTALCLKMGLRNNC